MKTLTKTQIAVLKYARTKTTVLSDEAIGFGVGRERMPKIVKSLVLKELLKPKEVANWSGDIVTAEITELGRKQLSMYY